MPDLNPDDKLFSASTNKTVSTTELTFMLLKNPSGSGKFFTIKQFIANNIHTIADSFVRFRIYSDPTLSADGTALSEPTLDVGSGKTATGTAFLTPTVSANGTLLFDISASQGRGTPFDFPDGFQLQENHNLLITIISDGANRVGAATLVWEEN